VLRPIGELDASWGRELRDLMTEVAELHGNRLIVDLAGVGFVDSTAIGVLTGGWKRARNAGGDVRLAGANAFVRRVLDITGLGKVFDSFGSVEEAATAP
jgi:anti-anti-sigma factor